MAKAREIPGLEPGMPTAAAAAAIVEMRAAELAEHAEGVLDTADIEGVHDMRVATRRLRAALEIFRDCFPKQAYRSALRDVKRLADALGERRDRDVAIDELQGFAGALAAPDRPGIDSLVATLRREQSQANADLERFVDDEAVAAIRSQVALLVTSARAIADQGQEAVPS